MKNKLEQKRDVIHDLEQDLEMYERKRKENEENLDSKERELNDFEKIISEQAEEINALRDNKQSIVSQIAENIYMEIAKNCCCHQMKTRTGPFCSVALI